VVGRPKAFSFSLVSATSSVLPSRLTRRTLRYDNPSSAVKKILRGRQREETERVIAFRSHWGFRSEYFNPAKGNEKGGVEGELGWSA
jgi:hypothetical protein